MKALPAAAWTAALFLCACLFTHTVALRLALLIPGVLLCIWAIARDREAVRALPPIWIAFVLWAAWAALTIAWSDDAARSEKEFRNEIVYAGAGLWLCFVAAQAEHARRIFIPIVSGGIVAVCAMAIYYFSPAAGKYLGGWHGGPGDHSSALLTLAPCVLVFALQGPRRRWSGLIASVLGLVIAASAYTTLNRTIWLGFAVQLGLIAAFMLSRRWEALGGRTRVLVVVVLCAMLAGAAAMLAVVQAEREAARSAVPIKQDPRLALWPEVIDLVKERPLTGYGFGRGLMRRTLAQEIGDTMLWHSHNLFLDVALQAGLPGLGLFLLLLGSVAWVGWKAARGPSGLSRACGISLLAVLAGMLVRNMTDVLWVRQNALLFWGVTGALLAWMPPQRPSAA